MTLALTSQNMHHRSTDVAIPMYGSTIAVGLYIESNAGTMIQNLPLSRWRTLLAVAQGLLPELDTVTQIYHLHLGASLRHNDQG